MFRRVPVWLIPAVLLAAPVVAEERNAWPLRIQEVQADGTVESEQNLGPLLFENHRRDEPIQRGFRPFYLQTLAGNSETEALFYPLFVWKRQDGFRSFSFFQLLNTSQVAEPGQPALRTCDFWPFYFSRETGEPETSYRALFPIAGTIKQRLGYDRARFVLFPLYAETDQKGAHTTHAPWPFLRFIEGNGNHGFEFWPLFGHRARAQGYESQFYLWPLVYKSVSNLSEPQPDVKLGFLPFYTRDTAPGYISENYLWPFFGYTHRTAPVAYDERRYFWPFLVQGRGPASYTNRWGPFYTHSVIKGYDKTWLAWPLFRHASWADGGIAQEQNQVLFFLYWSLTQRSTTNPAAAPAHKTHLWPLFSSWDNGAGHRQVQLLSPFEVFLPTNEPVRLLYTPLFALYRYDQRAPGDTRQSLLFNLVSWKNSPAEKEFHFGPLFSRRRTPDAARVTLGNGLFSWRRRAETGRWSFSLFDFQPDSANKAAKPALP